MFFHNLKSKRGSSTVYELLISLTLLTFVMMFPIGLFSFLHSEIAINDVATLAMQTLERDGQLTPELIDTINDNLSVKGLPTLGEKSTVIVTNMNVSSLVGNKVQSQMNTIYSGNGEAYSKFVYITNTENNRLTEYFNKDVGASKPWSYGYLKKYRNGFIIATSNTSASNTVWYDIKCNNPSCTHKNQIGYLSSDQPYKCPWCNRVIKLETGNSANVVYMTLAVPVTDKVAFLNRVMSLISFGVGDVNEIFSGSSTFINSNGQYYFVKTLYGTAERYYYRGGDI